MTLTQLHSTLKHLPGKHNQKLHGRKSAQGTSDEYMSAVYKATVTKLEYAKVIRHYTSGGYMHINSLLRDGDESGLRGDKLATALQSIDYLDAAVSEAPALPKSLIVHRGISRAAAVELQTLKVGDYFTDKGFVSTTIDASGIRDDFGNGGILHILVPKGSKGLYVADVANYREEYEFILPRNSTFMITSADAKRGEYHMKVIK